jgi:hypothetical protein
MTSLILLAGGTGTLSATSSPAFDKLAAISDGPGCER